MWRFHSHCLNNNISAIRILLLDLAVPGYSQPVTLQPLCPLRLVGDDQDQNRSFATEQDKRKVVSGDSEGQNFHC